MPHNIDNRRRRERRQSRALQKAVRRFNAFERQPTAGAKNPAERFRLWLKRWRARYPTESRGEEALSRIYKLEHATLK